jgi:hypothetical protein
MRLEHLPNIPCPFRNARSQVLVRGKDNEVRAVPEVLNNVSLGRRQVMAAVLREGSLENVKSPIEFGHSKFSSVVLSRWGPGRGEVKFRDILYVLVGIGGYGLVVVFVVFCRLQEVEMEADGTLEADDGFVQSLYGSWRFDAEFQA